MRTDPAKNAEQSFPPSNTHFRRRWADDVSADAPDTHKGPTHGLCWHAPVLARRVDALARHAGAKQAAEAAWERLTGGSREAGLHVRGDRG